MSVQHIAMVQKFLACMRSVEPTRVQLDMLAEDVTYDWFAAQDVPVNLGMQAAKSSRFLPAGLLHLLSTAVSRRVGPERPRTRLVEVAQSLAREAIIADIADRSLDAWLVLGSTHTRGVDEEAAAEAVILRDERHGGRGGSSVHQRSQL